MATDKKTITINYWDSLDKGSRLRALKAALPHFSDSTLRSYAEEKAKNLGRIWEVIKRTVKMPVGNSNYKTCVNGWWMM